MKRKAPSENTSVEHGKWGEDTAARFLSSAGYEIIDRNVRPHPKDRRLEIDIVAFDPKRDVVVFVEVKQHAARNPRASRMQSVDKGKLERLRRACRVWIARNKWRAGYRFDVVEIYGVPHAGKPEFDHIERVRLFKSREEFVNWDS